MQNGSLIRQAGGGISEGAEGARCAPAASEQVFVAAAAAKKGFFLRSGGEGGRDRGQLDNVKMQGQEEDGRRHELRARKAPRNEF